MLKKYVPALHTVLGKNGVFFNSLLTMKRWFMGGAAQPD